MYMQYRLKIYIISYLYMYYIGSKLPPFEEPFPQSSCLPMLLAKPMASNSRRAAKVDVTCAGS